MARVVRPRLLPALSIFLVALLGVTAWIGVRALLAQRHLTAARADLVSAREALVGQDAERARTAIVDAGGRTARARGLTSDPLWRLAAAVPFYGGTAQTVRGLAVAADETAREVLPRALEAADGLDPAKLRRADGAVDLELLGAATPSLVESADRASSVRQELLALPSEQLPAAVSRARQELLDQVEELDDALDGAADALQVAPALLGEDRPRRYLLLVQQTSESRGTGGLFGGFVELVADRGRISVASTGSNRELRRGEIPVPAGVPADFVARYQDFDAFRLWQSANLSPDLPVVAKVVQARWQAQGGQPLDGVAMADSTALAAILDGTGPIVLPDGRQIRPAELERYLAVDQYVGVPLGRPQAERKDALGDLAAVVADRLTDGGGETDLLLRGIAQAVSSGHLKLASDDPTVLPVLREHGVDGALPEGNAPVAYPVVYNDSEAKLDYFLDRSIAYTGEGCADEQRRTRVVVTLTNTAPPSEELPPYLQERDEDGRRLVSNVNRTALSLYGTRGAVLLGSTVDDAAVQPGSLTAGTEGGLPVWSLVLDLPAGQPRSVAFDLLEPTAPGSARVPEQPLARPLEVDVSVPAC